MPIVVVIPGGSVPTLDAATTAWVAAVVAAGGTVSTGQKTNVDTLIRALKSHSLFSIQDRIWLHASENTTQATIDIVNLGVATTTSAPTFTANQGFTGDGIANFYNSNYTNGTNFVLNSASLSTYVRTSRTTNGLFCAVGSWDTASQCIILPLQNSGVTTYDINNGNFNDQAASGTGNAQGFWTTTRTGATAVALYHNSNSTAILSTAQASTTNAGTNFFIGARSNVGSADEFSTDQLAITTMGGGLTNTQAAQFQTDLNAYKTSLGTNVY